MYIDVVLYQLHSLNWILNNNEDKVGKSITDIEDYLIGMRNKVSILKTIVL